MSHFYTVFAMAEDVLKRYPLGRDDDAVRTPGGLRLAELTLDDARVTPEELRATPETLALQAEIAEASGRAALGANLRRAAELAAIPQDVVLAIYTALRPRRSTAAELERWAASLEQDGAVATAAFIREAAQVYVERGLLA
jgi:propanediol dehydratase small subunit